MVLRMFAVVVPAACLLLLSVGCGLSSKQASLVDESLLESARLRSASAGKSGNLSAKVLSATCDGKPVGSTEQRIRFDKDSVAFGDICQPEVQMRICNSGQWSTWSGSFTAEKCLMQKSLDCVGGANGTSESRIRYKSSNVAFGSSCRSETQTRTCKDGQWSAWSGDFSEGVCSVGEAASCGSKIHGSYESRVRYKSASVEFGRSCEGEMQIRFCNNGNFESWSGAFESDSCSSLPASSCVLQSSTYGANALDLTFPHGGVTSRVRFKESSPMYGVTCESEIQIASCFNGKSSGFSGTFSAENCKSQAAKGCEYKSDAGVLIKNLAHAESVSKVVYESLEVDANQQCKSEIVTGICNNGVIEFGKSSFSAPKASCAVKSAVPCVDSNGKLVASGMTEIATKYANSSVKFGETCQPEIRSRSCSNGAWSAWNGSANYSECSVAKPASCGLTAHGGSETQIRYEKATVAFGQSCNSEVQQRTCNNGLVSAWSGTYSNGSCSILPPLSCGNTRHNGIEVRVRYAAGSVPFGSSCQSEIQTRSCSNGVFSEWSGSNSVESCTVQSAAACGSVASGTTETRKQYLAKSASFGQSCQEEIQSRTCNNGTFSSWSGTFAEASCSVAAALPCGTTPHGDIETRTRYFSSTANSSGQCISEVQTRACSNGSFGNWSGSYQADKCENLVPQVKVFNYTGASQTFTIPPGVSSVEVKAWGGGGCIFDETPAYAASNNSEFGGAGGFSSARISVTPGEILRIDVAGGGRGTGNGGWPNGGNYYNGGCPAGGSSNVYSVSNAQNTVLIVAGGGGGGGWYTGNQTNGAPGGGLTAFSSQSKGGGAGGEGGSQTQGGQLGNGKGGYLRGGTGNGNGGTGGPGAGGGGFFGGASGSGGFGSYNTGGGGGSCFVGFPQGSTAVASDTTPPAAGTVSLKPTGSFNNPNDYIETETSVRMNGTRSFSAAQCLTGLGRIPPKMDDSDYLAGVAVGGDLNTNFVQHSPGVKTGGGGHGRVVIRYSVPASQAVTSTAASASEGMLYRSTALLSTKEQILANATPIQGGAAFSAGEYLYVIPPAAAQSGAAVFDLDGTGGANFLPWWRDGSNWVTNGNSYGWTWEFNKFTYQATSNATSYKLGLDKDFYLISKVGSPEGGLSAAGTAPRVVRYTSSSASAPTTVANVAASGCAADEGSVNGLGCLFKDGNRYLIGVISQNSINPAQVSGSVRPDQVSKVIDDARWMVIWNAADNTSNGNWRLVAQMETSANAWEINTEPPANNIYLMKNANRLPLVKSLSAPVLTAYVYSLFHHEDDGATWMGGDYSGIIYGGPNGYSTFGWYNQARTNNFFNSPYNYASSRMRLWIYPPASATSTALPPARKSTFSYTGAVQTWTAQRAASATNPIIIKLWGAGGATVGAAGGGGGYAQISVTSGINAGESLQVYVGGAGLPGSASRSAGGGGGASAVMKGTNILAVAAGGGGSHAVGGSGYGGAGGGSSGEQGGPDGCAGGSGGAGASGSAQGSGGTSNRGYSNGQSGQNGAGGDGGSGAGGSTQSGTGGWGWRNGGNAGTVPGDGGGGGGGGGYAGGGGGGGGCWGLGGGGGSSYANSSFGSGTLTGGSRSSAGHASDADNSGAGAAAAAGRVVISD